MACSSARARRTKAANSACCFIKTCDFRDDGLHGWRENQLRNLRPARHRERLGAEIDENDVEFPAVIGVERAGSIEYRDAEMQREPGAGSNLSFQLRRKGKREPGWDSSVPPRRDDDGRGHRGDEVEADRLRLS